MRKYGAMALIVPALLPPPAPFKIFVLMGGVANIPLPTFIWAIALGRGVRYFGEGVLAIMYGQQAIDYIHGERENCCAGARRSRARRWCCVLHLETPV